MWAVLGDDHINIHFTLIDCQTLLCEIVLCFPDNGLTHFYKGINDAITVAQLYDILKKYLI